MNKNEPRSAVCTYDCPDACGLVVRRDGERIKIGGDPDHPITQGFVCYRVHAHEGRLRDPERITRPLLLTPSGRRELSWDAALDLAAEKLGAALRDHGPASVVPILGGGSLGLSKTLVGHFFGALGPVTTVRGGICGEAGEAAQALDFGTPACHDYTDLAHSAAVVLWGKNPVATGLHLVPFVKQARDRGAPVVLVDPVPVESARLADRVIRVAPGRDGDLALGVLRLLHRRGALDPAAVARSEGFAELERWLAAEASIDACARAAGVPPGDLEHLADLYASIRPLATMIGWGLQRHVSGGHSVRCIDALALLSGNVGRRGGGANFTSWRARGLDRSRIARGGGRTISAPFLGQELSALSDPPARVVYVAGSNPVTQHADSHATARALRQVDFTVVADAFMTDTARAADLVLPVTLMLEDDDVVGSYQHHHVARGHKAVEPPAGSRSDLWILDELGRRLGRADDPLLSDPRQALEEMTRPWFSGSPRSARSARNPSQEVIPFSVSFDTPSGKANLVTGPFTPGEAEGSPAGGGDFPLSLMSISSRRWQTSLLLEREQQGPAECLVHPAAPGAAALGDGAAARLESEVGSLDVELRLDPRLREDLCVVYRGGWVCCGRGVNALVAGRSTDLGEGTAFYSQRVRIAPPGGSAGAAAPRG